jgi:hypothetical protein
MLEHQTSIDHFVASARAYCALIERAAALTTHQFAEEGALALADLYGHALRLPSVEPCSQEYERQAIFLPHSVGSVLAELSISEGDNEYTFDSVNSVMIADDLNDIYAELLRNLHVYDEGTDCSRRDAVWEWKFGFETHWREHLMHALYALDRILREDMLPLEPGT